MKIVIYSDIHNSGLELLHTNPDLVFLLGDIYWTDVKKIANHYKCPKLGVLGNHDRMDTFKGTDVIDVHKQIIEINDIKITGFGGCPRYNHKVHVPQYEEYEIRKYVDQLDKVQFFLSHANPAFDFEPDRTNPHRGFLSLTEMMEQRKTRFLFHGHVHENEMYDYYSSTIISTYGIREIEL